MTAKASRILMATLVGVCVSTASHAAGDDAAIKAAVDAAIKPVMRQYDIPGMAVGVTTGGHTYAFQYGLADRESRKPVTSSTLFEVGSISKTFTVSLTSLAEVNGQLSLSDKVSKYLPIMQGRDFGAVSLMSLGTHTPGGFPLQVPDDIKNNGQLMTYLQNWKPAYKEGTVRTYANPSIGMLGFITARAMKKDFAALMEGDLFPRLGLTSTYIHVPEAKMADYAQGYTKTNAPIRMADAVLSSEAYGVRTTAADMIHFVEANMQMLPLDEKLQRAITNTHTGYFKVGAMTQDLIWEQYAFPVDLQALSRGNSNAVALKATPVTQLTPSERPRADVWINKTGSTNGFGGYVAFVPERKLGIVILANKGYPNEVRAALGYRILTQLDSRKSP